MITGAGQKHAPWKLSDPLLRALVAAAILVSVLIAIATLHPGDTTSVLVLPWFIPAIDCLLNLVTAAVAFLAFGRFQVHQDPTSFWTAIGFSAFAVCTGFHLLTFPGLLPSGQPLFGRLPSTSAWASFVGRQILITALLVSSIARWPGASANPTARRTLTLAFWVAAGVVLNLVMIVREEDLPELVRPGGSFNSLTFVIHLTATAVQGVGIVLSIRHYLRTRDVLSAYIALCLLAMLYMAIVSLIGGTVRYGLWWYLGSIGWAVGFVTVLFGLLREYVRLFQRERLTTRQLRQSEARFRSSELRFRSVVENMTEALVIFDAQRNLIYQNPASLRIHGYATSGSGLVGKDQLPTTWVAWDMEGKPLTYDDWPVSRVFSGEQVRDRVIRVRRVETGHEFYGIYNGSAIYESGQLLLVYMTIREITEQVRAEAAVRHEQDFMRRLIERLPVMLTIYDPKLHSFRFNRAFREILGWTEEDANHGNLLELAYPDPQVRQAAEDHMSRPRSEWKEFPITTKDGGIIPSTWTNLRLSDDRQVGIGIDLRSQKAAERVLREANQELERRVHERTAALRATLQELEAFSYTVSHDLRSPLRAIDGFNKRFMKEYADRLDERGKNFLSRSSDAAQRMGRLIDDLLAFSRLSRTVIKVQEVDLSALARSVITELRSSDPERAVKVSIESNLRTRGDPGLLRSVMQNLLGNAWKYSSKVEHARIEFGRTVHQQKEVFFVRDNGAGFDMTYSAKLFGAFERLHAEEDFEGTGIGLATVRRILHRHGGEIWAKAAVKRGATFYFTIGDAGKQLGLLHDGDIDKLAS